MKQNYNGDIQKKMNDGLERSIENWKEERARMEKKLMKANVSPEEFENQLFNNLESESESDSDDEIDFYEEESSDDEPKYLEDGNYNPRHPDYQRELKDHQATFPSNNFGNEFGEQSDDSEEFESQDERISDTEDEERDFQVINETEIINEEVEQGNEQRPAWTNRRTSFGGLSTNNAQVAVILVGLVISLISGANGTYISPQGIAPTNFNTSISIQICQLEENDFYLNKLGKQKIGETMVTWTTKTKMTTLRFEGSGTGDRVEVCQKAKEIFDDEWKKMWAEKFADENQPEIQCDPVNIKVKDGVTLHGQKPHRMTKNSEKEARAKIDDMVHKKHLRTSWYQNQEQRK